MKHTCSGEVTFSSFLPGGLSTLCSIQSKFYSEVWGFNHLYESVVSASVGDFLARYDDKKDFVRLVLDNNVVRGGVVIDRRDGVQGQLRWFIVEESLKGTGIGRQLISDAMAFVKAQQLQSVFLTTFEGLDTARRLYEAFGFKLVNESLASTWGKEVKEQRFEWKRE